MVSVVLASAICEDAGILYQDTCDKSIKEVMESERFITFADKIRAELPEITNQDIMRHLILVYSEVIRAH